MHKNPVAFNFIRICVHSLHAVASKVPSDEGEHNMQVKPYTNCTVKDKLRL